MGSTVVKIAYNIQLRLRRVLRTNFESRHPLERNIYLPTSPLKLSHLGSGWSTESMENLVWKYFVCRSNNFNWCLTLSSFRAYFGFRFQILSSNLKYWSKNKQLFKHYKKRCSISKKVSLTKIYAYFCVVSLLLLYLIKTCRRDSSDLLH